MELVVGGLLAVYLVLVGCILVVIALVGYENPDKRRTCVAMFTLDVVCIAGVAFFTTDDVTQRLRGLDFEGTPRIAFWLGCMAAFMAAVVVVGTVILLVPNVMCGSNSYLKLDRQDIAEAEAWDVLVLPAVLAGYLGVAMRVIFRASAAGELNVKGGLEFEAWATLLFAGGGWCLVQAVVAIFFRPGDKFDKASFAGAMMPAVVPFISDTFDSAKDICFAALALGNSDSTVKAIGWASLVLIVIVHVFMYSTAGGRLELKYTYLSVFLVAARNDSMKDAHKEGVVDKIGLTLVKQTTADRAKFLILEDAPQGVLAVCFSTASGTFSPFVIALNIAIPLVRICAAKFLRGYILSWEFVLRGLTRPLIKGTSPEVRKWTFEQLKYALESNGDTIRQHVDAFAAEYLEAQDESFKLTPEEWHLGDQIYHLAMSFARAFEGNTSLRQLTFVSTGIDSEGATALAKALEANKTLQNLDLEQNKIGPEGATALAKALEANETLQNLSLVYNKIGSEGATALAKALEANKTLQNLNLDRNGIGSQGATALAKALEVNTSLKNLTLFANCIDGEGAIALAEVLQGGKNTALQYLLLVENRLTGNQALADAVEARSGSLTIDF